MKYFTSNALFVVFGWSCIGIKFGRGKTKLGFSFFFLKKKRIPKIEWTQNNFEFIKKWFEFNCISLEMQWLFGLHLKRKRVFNFFQLKKMCRKKNLSKHFFCFDSIWNWNWLQIEFLNWKITFLIQDWCLDLKFGCILCSKVNWIFFALNSIFFLI